MAWHKTLPGIGCGAVWLLGFCVNTLETITPLVSCQKGRQAPIYDPALFRHELASQ